jgi:hypothetical protein
MGSAAGGWEETGNNTGNEVVYMGKNEPGEVPQDQEGFLQ